MAKNAISHEDRRFLVRLIESLEEAFIEFPDVSAFVAFEPTFRWLKQNAFGTLIRYDIQLMLHGESARFELPHCEHLLVFAKKEADEKKILHVLNNLALRTSQGPWYLHPSGYNESTSIHPAEINWLRWLVEELWDDSEMVEHFVIAEKTATSVARLKHPLFLTASHLMRKFV